MAGLTGREDRQTVAFLGGTGPQGQGLALRLALAGYPVILGSRDAARAAGVATALDDGRGLALSGATNEEAAQRSEVIYLCFPYEAQAPSLEGLTDLVAGKTVIDVINPIAFDEYGAYVIAVADGSAAEEAQRLLPSARVASGFHDVSARLLLQADRDVPTDVLICGDDDAAKDVALAHAGQIPGMRGLDAGRLRMSRELEGFTAVLLAVNRRYRVRSGVRMSGVTDEKLAAAARLDA